MSVFVWQANPLHHLFDREMAIGHEFCPSREPSIFNERINKIIILPLCFIESHLSIHFVGWFHNEEYFENILNYYRVLPIAPPPVQTISVHTKCHKVYGFMKKISLSLIYIYLVWHFFSLPFVIWLTYLMGSIDRYEEKMSRIQHSDFFLLPFPYSLLSL